MTLFERTLTARNGYTGALSFKFLLVFLSKTRTSPMTRVLISAILFSALAFSTSAQETKSDAAAPLDLTDQQDHKLMMEALKITELRQGANGRNRDAPNAANYDESKANPYPNLPDPLVLKNGGQVTSTETWWSKRRPEIVEDFDREVYGRVPKDVPKVTWEATGTTEEKVGGILAVTKKLVGHVDNSKCPQIKVDIQLTLTTPAEAKGPVPVMMEFGFVFAGPGPGGATGKAATKKAMTKAAPPGGFGDGGPSWQQQLLAKGWGYAIIIPTSYQADNGAGLTKGIIGLCNLGQPRKPEDWGRLRAWAWGASRALDYFETDKAVDAKQVGIEGLSRLWQGSACHHGLRPAVRHRLHRFVGRGRRQTAQTPVRRAGRESHRLRRVSLDGRKLPQVRRPAHSGRPSSRCARVDRAVRPSADVYQLRSVNRSEGRGTVGRSARQLHGRGRGRTRLQAPWEERSWHNGIPRGRNRADRRRTRLQAT